ncbi:MAG TPA: hypothetical protein VJN69_03275 [Candidatus Acidoferrales bacterium]|nr:hypothetical protein [Candidatus Acidoferrales bacterium]
MATTMDAYLSWRKTRPSDLAQCLALHAAKNGAEIVGRARASEGWRQLLEMTHATRSAVVETHTKSRAEIVGFGLASFVKESFVQDEVRNPRPGLNSRIIESVVSGNPVVATYVEVRDANTRGGLQQVILDTSWKNGDLAPVQVDEVRVVLGRAYQEMFAGYRFSRILVELVDELDSWHVRGLKAFRTVNEFEDFYRANPGTKWNRERRLIDVTLDSIRADPHSVAAGLFQHHVRPQFAFITQGEQELLELALDGVEDAVAADSLFVSLPAVKRLRARGCDQTGYLPLGRRGNQRDSEAPTHFDVRQEPS